MNAENVFSGAGYIQVEHLNPPKMNGMLPEKGAYIELYEKRSTYRNPLFFVSLGTFRVMEFTSILVICQIKSCILEYTTTFPISDFRCGLLQFKEKNPKDELVAVV